MATKKNPKYKHLPNSNPPPVKRITEATRDPGLPSRKRTARGDRKRW